MRRSRFLICLVLAAFVLSWLLPAPGASALSLAEAMEQVNAAETRTQVRTILGSLNPPGWSGLTSSGKNYAADWVLAGKPYSEVTVFELTIGTAIALEGMNDVIYDLNTGSQWLQDDIANTVLAINGLNPAGWSQFEQEVKERIVLELATALVPNYYTTFDAFNADLAQAIAAYGAWETAMNAVNNAANRTGARSAVTTLNPPAWSGLTSSAKNYVADALLAGKPFSQLLVFQHTLRLAIAMEGVNDCIYDLPDGQYLEEDIANTVIAFGQLQIPAWAGLSTEARRQLVLDLAWARHPQYYVSLTAFEDAIHGMLSDLSDDASLMGLTGSVVITPEFSKDVKSYFAVVSEDTQYITLTLTPTETDAVVRIYDQVAPNGEASQPVWLGHGLNLITITVTAPNGVSTETYTLKVTREGTPATGEIKGSLVIVGGGLDPRNDAIYQRFMELAASYRGRALSELKIGIVPAGNATPVQSANSYRSDFVHYGALAGNVITLPIAVLDDPSTPEDESAWYDNALDPALAEVVRELDAIWFVGGDQLRFMATLVKEGKSTPVLDAIWEIYEAGAVLGGSSAGAAIMTQPMIGGGTPASALANGVTYVDGEPGVFVTRGLGFMTHGLVDQHFSERNRLPRLLVAALHQGIEKAYGVDEDTALVVDNTNKTVSALGTGGVTVIHLADGLTLSWLSGGDVLNWETGAFTPGADKTMASPVSEQGHLDTNILANLAIRNLLRDGLVKSSADSAVGLSRSSVGEGYEFTFSRTPDFQAWTGSGNSFSLVGVRMTLRELDVLDYSTGLDLTAATRYLRLTASQLEGALAFTYGGLEFSVPQGAWSGLTGQVLLGLSPEAVEAPEGMVLHGSAYSFRLWAGNQLVDSFSAAITVSFPLPGAEELAVYRLNPATGTWTPVPGEVVEGRLVVTLSGFSTYALFDVLASEEPGDPGPPDSGDLPPTGTNIFLFFPLGLSLAGAGLLALRRRKSA